PGPRECRWLAPVSPFDQCDLPEVVGEVLVQQVGVGHRKMAFHTPFSYPRIPHSKPVLPIIVADRQHGVSANHTFTWSRHRHYTGASDFITLETFVNRKPEQERIAGSQTAFHLRKTSRNSLILHRGVVQRLFVADS